MLADAWRVSQLKAAASMQPKWKQQQKEKHKRISKSWFRSPIMVLYVERVVCMYKFHTCDIKSYTIHPFNHPLIHSSIHSSINQWSIHPSWSMYLSIHPSIHDLSVHVSIHPYIHPSTRTWSIHPSIYRSICPSIQCSCPSRRRAMNTHVLLSISSSFGQKFFVVKTVQKPLVCPLAQTPMYLKRRRSTFVTFYLFYWF